MQAIARANRNQFLTHRSDEIFGIRQSQTSRTPRRGDAGTTINYRGRTPAITSLESTLLMSDVRAGPVRPRRHPVRPFRMPTRAGPGAGCGRASRSLANWTSRRAPDPTQRGARTLHLEVLSWALSIDAAREETSGACSPRRGPSEPGLAPRRRRGRPVSRQLRSASGRAVPGVAIELLERRSSAPASA